MFLGMFLLVAVGVGYTQNVVRVTIPFNFTAGRQSFSAGEYTFKTDPLFRTMVLRNQAGHIVSNIPTYSVESKAASNSGKLVFNRYGGRYFLAEIWGAESTSGRQLIMSPVEIEMANAQHSPGQQIALNLAPH